MMNDEASSLFPSSKERVDMIDCEQDNKLKVNGGNKTNHDKTKTKQKKVTFCDVVKMSLERERNEEKLLVTNPKKMK